MADVVARGLKGSLLDFQRKLDLARSSLNSTTVHFPGRDRFIFEWLCSTLSKLPHAQQIDLTAAYWKLLLEMLLNNRKELLRQPIRAPLLGMITSVITSFNEVTFQSFAGQEWIRSATSILDQLTKVYQHVFLPTLEAVTPAVVATLELVSTFANVDELAGLCDHLLQLFIFVQRQQPAQRKVFTMICSKMLAPLLKATDHPQLGISGPAKTILQEGLFHVDHLSEFNLGLSVTHPITQKQSASSKATEKASSVMSYQHQLFNELQKLMGVDENIVKSSLPILLQSFVNANEARRRSMMELASNTAQRTPKATVENTHDIVIFDFFQEAFALLSRSSITPLPNDRMAVLHKLLQIILNAGVYVLNNEDRSKQQTTFLEHIWQDHVRPRLQIDLVCTATLDCVISLLRLNHLLLEEHVDTIWQTTMSILGQHHMETDQTQHQRPRKDAAADLAAAMIDVYSKLRQSDVCITAILRQLSSLHDQEFSWPCVVTSAIATMAASTPPGQIVLLQDLLIRGVCDIIAASNQQITEADGDDGTVGTKRKSIVAHEDKKKKKKRSGASASTAAFDAALAMLEGFLSHVRITEHLHASFQNRLKQAYTDTIESSLTHSMNSVALHLLFSKVSNEYSQTQLTTEPLLQLSAYSTRDRTCLSSALLQRLRFVEDPSEGERIAVRVLNLLKEGEPSVQVWKCLLNELPSFDRFFASSPEHLGALLNQLLNYVIDRSSEFYESSYAMLANASFYELQGFRSVFWSTFSALCPLNQAKKNQLKHVDRLSVWLQILLQLPPEYLPKDDVISFISRMGQLNEILRQMNNKTQAVESCLVDVHDIIINLLQHEITTQHQTPLLTKEISAMIHTTDDITDSMERLAAMFTEWAYTFLLTEASDATAEAAVLNIASACISHQYTKLAHAILHNAVLVLTAFWDRSHQGHRKPASTVNFVAAVHRLFDVINQASAELEQKWMNRRRIPESEDQVRWLHQWLRMTGVVLQFASLAAQTKQAVNVPNVCMTLMVLALFEEQQWLPLLLNNKDCLDAVCDVFIHSRLSLLSPAAVSSVLALLLYRQSCQPTTKSTEEFCLFFRSSSREQFLQLYRLLSQMLDDCFLNEITNEKCSLCVEIISLLLSNARPAQLQAIEKQLVSLVSRLSLLLQQTSSQATVSAVLTLLDHLVNEKAIKFPAHLAAAVLSVIDALQIAPFHQSTPFTPHTATAFHDGIYRVLIGLFRYRSDVIDKLAPKMIRVIASLLFCHGGPSAHRSANAPASPAAIMGWHPKSVMSYISSQASMLPRLCAENVVRVLTELSNHKRAFSRHAIFLTAFMLSLVEHFPPNPASRASLMVGMYALFGLLHEADNQQLLLSLDNAGRVQLKAFRADYLEHYKYHGKL